MWDNNGDAERTACFFKNKFDRIYLINLAERVDRKEHMARELKRVGLDISCDVELFKAIRPAEALAFPGLGVLGCYLSHLSVLRMAKYDGLGKILIVEDDLMISRRLPRVITYLSQQMDAIDWDILLLGFFPSRTLSLSIYYGDVDASFYSSVVFKKPRLLPGGMHFYAVNGRCLDRLILFLEHLLEVRSRKLIVDANGMDIAYLDDAFYRFSLDYPDIVYLMACPTLGWQRHTESSVGISRRYTALLGDLKNKIKTEMKNGLDCYWPAVLSKSPNASISGVIPAVIHDLAHSAWCEIARPVSGSLGNRIEGGRHKAVRGNRSFTRRG
ncbi:MAG: glycosyltransferase family 25 protein [Rhodoplanes sp.]